MKWISVMCPAQVQLNLLFNGGTQKWNSRSSSLATYADDECDDGGGGIRTLARRREIYRLVRNIGREDKTEKTSPVLKKKKRQTWTIIYAHRSTVALGTGNGVSCAFHKEKKIYRFENDFLVETRICELCAVLPSRVRDAMGLTLNIAGYVKCRDAAPDHLPSMRWKCECGGRRGRDSGRWALVGQAALVICALEKVVWIRCCRA